MDEWPELDRAIRVLVVEDDEEIASAVMRLLRAEGLDAKIAGDGETALELAGVFNPDVTLLDLGLPKLDGVEVAQRLRASGFEAAIIAVTARDAPESAVEGLDAGLDDYVVKPFDRSVLLARIRAVLRRRPPHGTASLVAGPLALDPGGKTATIAGRPVALTAKEFRMLEYLIFNRGLVVSKNQLLENVWDYPPDHPGMADSNIIEVFVSNLRRKLEEGGEPRILETVRGSGYVIRG